MTAPIRAPKNSPRQRSARADNAPPPPIRRGFPAIAALNARILILGSMPGAASLAAREYYAHRQNAFWRIMAEVFGFSPAAPYARRRAELLTNGIAVWDVLAACRRAGSADAAIETSDAAPNAFAAFLRQHRRVQKILFNGACAARLYARQVAPALPAAAAQLPRHTLPSTSPAYAAMPYAEKLRRWRAALQEEGAFLPQHRVLQE